MIDEKELIRNAKSGDMKSYEQIIGLYEKRVFSTIYYMVKNESEVEDIAQEVFIKIYKNLKNFKEESSLYTWIYRITINVCLDEIKRRKKVVYLDEKINSDDGELEIQITDNGKTPSEIVEGKDLKERLSVISDNFDDLPSTNFLLFLNRFENNDTSWIDDINHLKK